MGRRFKNSDDNTFFVDKAIESKLEKLRMELITGYAEKKRDLKKRGQKRDNKKLPKR